MRDIAKHANASVSTVSRVLTGNGYVSEETYACIMKACNDLQYDFNKVRSNKGQKDRVIGIIISDLENDYNVHIIKGISNVTDSNGYETIIYDTRGSLQKEENAFRMFIKLSVSGIVFVPIMHKHTLSSSLLNEIEKDNLPVVLVESDLEYSNFDSVFVNNVAGSSEVVEAFVKGGHRKIATIAGPESSKTGYERLVGYKKGLHMADIPITEAYIQQGEFTQEGGYAAMRKLMQLPDPPTAIFVANGIMIRGCYQYLMENGENLRKISLITFDDLRSNIFSIPIGVVVQPMEEMGEFGARILFDRIKQYPHKCREIHRIILSPKLALKGSENIMCREAELNSSETSM